MLGIVAVLVVHHARSRTVRTLVPVAAAGAVLAIGASRLYLGVHWLSDVLTSWLLGGALLALSTTVHLATAPRPDHRAAPVVAGR